MLYFKAKDGDPKELLVARDEVQAAAFKKGGLVETDKAGKPLPEKTEEE